jgi:hypothetical protein
MRINSLDWGGWDVMEDTMAFMTMAVGATGPGATDALDVMRPNSITGMVLEYKP